MFSFIYEYLKYSATHKIKNVKWNTYIICISKIQQTDTNTVGNYLQTHLSIMGYVS